MERFHEHPEPWGEFVDVKVNAAEALERQLRRATPGSVFVSSACDGWQPIEEERALTRECCRLLVARGFQINALTKSALILRDLDVFAGHEATVGTTVTTLDPTLKALWEPRADNVEDRFRIVQHARDAGLDTSIMFGPLLPFVYDNQDAVNALLERAADAQVDRIWVDALNPRPKVWPSVAGLLGRVQPGLCERYRYVLYSPKIRKAYLAGLRDRVERATKRYHLEGRVSTVFA